MQEADEGGRKGWARGCAGGAHGVGSVLKKSDRGSGAEGGESWGKRGEGKKEGRRRWRRDQQGRGRVQAGGGDGKSESWSRGEVRRGDAGG